MPRTSPPEKGVGGYMTGHLLRASHIKSTELVNASKKAKQRAEQGVMKSRTHRWVPLHRPGQRQSLEAQAAERKAGLQASEPGNR